MQHLYDVTVNGVVTVYAENEEEAFEKATEHITDLKKATVHWRWKDTARWMIDFGMSHSEVARTLGIDRSAVSKAFRGEGWTVQQGTEYRKQLAELDNAEIRKDTR